ncbi:MAG: fluoride efflux transporter CrcB [Cytophagia bacterium]|nr:fluoride efflux transporter CrcB [Cytophagia bacterium]|tara:strand:+ start:1780 stop:2145 length:366 start_codon:yes stop_codon:yes gene_type:complete
MKEIFYVGAGGMIGAILRYLIIKLSFFNFSFPINTFIVNILGCFLVGILMKYSSISNKELSNMINNFMIIGFCGGFTTFSAYSIDSINLLNESKYFLFLSYMISSSIIGIIFCYIGLNIIK